MPSCGACVLLAALLCLLPAVCGEAGGTGEGGAADAGSGGDVRYACGGGRTPSRFAYVMMHYEGTPKDPEYVLGTRVLIKSLQASGTEQDLVVLASTSVSAKSIKAFCSDGVIVQVVDDIPNPFKDTVKRRFLNALNKLHLWRMTRYERVVYLDSDNIVTHNADELFGCGRFCVVFMNPCHFHTGLIVVKPDLQEYDMLMATLQNGGKSYDGADQGFLSHVYGSELMSAPLFVQNRSASTHPDDLMRLPIGYNMHHLYRYETMSWEMFEVQRFKHLSPPFMSVTFPIAPALKPWNWLPYALFDMHWEWAKHREALNESFVGTVLGRVILVPILYAFVLVLGCITAHNEASKARITAGAQFLIRKLGIPRLSWIFAYLALFVGLWLSFMLVPQLLPPVHGWGLFILYINACVFTTLRLILLASGVDCTLPTIAAPVNTPSPSLTCARLMLLPLAAQAAGCVILFTDVQLLLVGNFLEKMLCIIGTWAGIVYTLARCVKWFLAGVLVDLTAQNTAKEVQE